MIQSTIENLAAQTANLFLQNGYNHRSIHEKEVVMRKIILLHKQHGCDCYSPEIMALFLRDAERRYQRQEIGKIRFRFYQKTADYLTQFHENGNLDLYSRNISTNLTPYYEKIFTRLHDYEGWSKSTKHYIRQFSMPYFKWLLQNGVTSLEQVTDEMIRKYLLDCSNRMTLNSVDTTKRVLKKLHRYLYEVEICKDSFSDTLSFAVPTEHIRMQDSGGLFDQFLQNTTISMVELYTADGVLVETPSNQNSFNDGITGEALGGASYESAPIISNSYYFSFADDNSQYILTVYGEASQIAELRQSFVSVLPILFCVILLVSLATAWVYSRIITNPVLKISRISKEMSDMKLEWQLEERRSDELGVLENSLNTLSRKLSATLEELQSANLQLQKDIEHQKVLERAQQDFFSSASHELKTPITIIKGQLEGMLLGIGAYKDHEKYLARSLEVAATLETMVQEILTISRLETNVDFKMEHFDCAPMIHGYLREIDDLVATKELQIHLAIQSPAFINGNKLLIEKVFSNLISNAVKYSPHGASVDIILQNTNGRFLFSVENTGTHIPEDDIPKLFDAFYRMEQSRSRRTGGSGLGLYMVQRILQQHNSYCEACNTENGVKFFFTI